MNRNIFTLVVTTLLLTLLLGIAFAGGSPAPVDPLEQGKGAYEAVRSGQWMMAVAFASMLLGSLARWAGGYQWKFLKSEAGGYTIAIFTGLGSLGAGYIESGALSVQLLMIAMTTMFASMGMHGPAKSLVKKNTGDAA